MSELEKYRDQLLGILQEETTDLWKEKDGDTEFLKNIADEIAFQRLQILNADSEERKTECRTNLEHLRTQLEGRIAAKRNDLISRGDWVLKKVLNVAIKVIMSAVLA